MFLRYWTKGDWQNREKLIQAMLDHNDHIRAIVPKDNLLEWNLQEGWEPLCNFLGKPVPDVPVPHINIGAADAPRHKRLAWERCFVLLRRALLKPLLVVVFVLVMAYCLRLSVKHL